MKIEGLHHVAIIASDYARSKRFYTEVLGLSIVAEVYREARDSWKLDLALPEACGLRHLAMRVTDIDQAVRHLHSHAVEVEAVRTDEYTGKRFTFFADPDGLPLELYEA
jgi:glyoxylase I family protein